MNRRALLAAAAATLTLVLTPAVRAGAADPSLTISGVDTSTPGTAQISVAVPPTLADRDLPASAWTVRESGKQVPVSVSGVPSDPTQVALTIDTSGSMRGTALDNAKAAARTFVDRMPAGAQIAVIGFGDQPYVASPFTTDRAATRAAIASLSAQGETAFYDAITTATGLFTDGSSHSLVALTDGKDTASTASLTSAASRLRDTGVSYYGVALATADADLRAVEDLATATGGQATTADRSGALDDVYRGIAAHITSQYHLTVATTRTGSTGFVVTVRDGDVAASGKVRVDLPVDPATPPAPAPVRSAVSSEPGWLQSGTALWLGLGLLFVGLAAGLALALSPRQARSQLEGARIDGVRNGASVLANLSQHATDLAERQLTRNDRGSRLNLALARAGLAVRPSEFVVIAATATFAVFAGALLLGNLLIALVLGGLVPVVCRAGITHLGRRRSERFADQLEQTLPLMAGSLRAGFGVMQAFDAVARESESPTADEFHRVVVESRLGRDLDDTLGSMAERVNSEDFDWVVQAIEIHRQVGGDLAEVLDNVYATIRDRNRIRRQIKALSAEGRLSALILFVLPFVMFGVIAVLNPDYLGELTGHTIGYVMLAVAGGMLTVGGLWLRRIVRLVF
jgi:tight adherence protein B